MSYVDIIVSADASAVKLSEGPVTALLVGAVGSFIIILCLWDYYVNLCTFTLSSLFFLFYFLLFREKKQTMHFLPWFVFLYIFSP